MAKWSGLMAAKQRMDQRLRAWDPLLADTFQNSFTGSMETVVTENPDGSLFVITGDIPAMWLRDSMWQVYPFLPFAKEDAEIRDLIGRVVQRQAFFVCIDPYANAFNNAPNGRAYDLDDGERSPWVWERKYEIDSLCAPLFLGYRFWQETGDSSYFNKDYHSMMHRVLEVFAREQHHETSPYRFERHNGVPTDTLSHEGKGAPVAYTGMTWSGFRPSDDSCDYGYLVPANMMAAIALGYAQEIATQVYQDEDLAQRAKALAEQIEDGIEQYAKAEHPKYGTVYAYEVDGMGSVNLMDDANVPSLLSIPLLGYRSQKDPVYVNTRAFVLSKDNPWYFEGRYAKGVGSPHTGKQLVWHLALAVQALTSDDDAEKRECLLSMLHTTAGTQLMHESFDPDNPAVFTRAWFGWANALFSALVIALLEDGFFERTRADQTEND